ncbi:MAG: hypothetical protein IPK66_03325 [Rhodospirillales bacterium]|nr:hypothetical protein [Rhodospirillales bacterium]
MRTDHYSLGPIPPPAEPGLRVVDDFPAEVPVTDAEMDVIEAFLGVQLRAILSGAPEEIEGVARGLNTDLNLCHNHARLRRPVPNRKSRE